MISSRTPEGPLNFCPICGTHCRIEPSSSTRDATCPRCGSLVWFDHPSQASPEGRRFGDASRWWEPGDYSYLWPWEPKEVTVEEIHAWEVRYSVRLPASLTAALSAQNGGRLVGTEIDIFPLGKFSTLNEGEWAGLAKGELPYPEGRVLMFQAGCLPGGRLILDYRNSPVPRVRNMDHVFDGELRFEVASFDKLVRSHQTRSGRNT